MSSVIGDFIRKYGVRDVGQETRISSANLTKYINGERPNGVNALALYEYSLKRGQPLDELKPRDENSWYVQLSRVILESGKSVAEFAKETGISRQALSTHVSGQIPNLNSLTPNVRINLYNATVKVGKPLEILKPTGYEQHDTKPLVKPISPKPKSISEEHLREGLLRLFNAVIDVLPHLRDSTDPERIKELLSQDSKKTTPTDARNLAYALRDVLESYVQATPDERERFRKTFYGDMRQITQLAQLIDSLRTEESMDRLKAMRLIR